MKSVRDRDKYDFLPSITIRQRGIKTNIYVTFAVDSNEDLLEVLITQGKAGSDISAYAEGLARTISIALQSLDDPLGIRIFLQRLIHSLRGIQGENLEFLGEGEKALSNVDAISKAFERYYLSKYKVSSSDLIPNGLSKGNDTETG